VILDPAREAYDGTVNFLNPVGWILLIAGWLQRRRAHRAAESVMGFRDAVRNGEIGDAGP
jgi:hypothetical protein